MRALRPEMSEEMRDVVRNGGTLQQAQLAAGKLLLEVAKSLVPVDSGKLQESGYAILESK